jgi:hypothetical protein
MFTLENARGSMLQMRNRFASRFTFGVPAS